jgi:D-hexose-6-phosphate mutarotase
MALEEEKKKRNEEMRLQEEKVQFAKEAKRIMREKHQNEVVRQRIYNRIISVLRGRDIY